jgi:hypothetical protein
MVFLATTKGRLTHFFRVEDQSTATIVYGHRTDLFEQQINRAPGRRIAVDVLVGKAVVPFFANNKSLFNFSTITIMRVLYLLLALVASATAFGM